MYAGLLFRFVILNKYIIVVKRVHREIVSGRYNESAGGLTDRRTGSVQRELYTRLY